MAREPAGQSWATSGRGTVVVAVAVSIAVLMVRTYGHAGPVGWASACTIYWTSGRAARPGRRAEAPGGDRAGGPERDPRGTPCGGDGPAVVAVPGRRPAG